MCRKTSLKLVAVHAKQARLQSVECYARLISGDWVITYLKKPILILGMPHFFLQVESLCDFRAYETRRI